MGIPKRDADDSRPIAIASVILRAWHKTLLDWIPNLPREQWSEKGVIAATLDWLNAKGSAGGEIDLAKAFDTVPHSAANAALGHEGVPDCVVDWLLAAWGAPRRCHVI